MKKIGRFSNSGTAKGLAAAIIWQFANYALPLVSSPYLARMLGVKGLGMIGLAAAISGVAMMVTDWGFNLSGTQAVSQNREDKVAVNQIVWSVIGAKALLGTLSAVVMIIATFYLVKDDLLKWVLIMSATNIIGPVFNVDWALRGLERLGDFAKSSIIGRLIALPLVFLMVRSQADVVPAILWTALGAIFVALITLYIAVRHDIMSAPSVSLHTVRRQIVEGWDVFLSQAAFNFYTSFLTIILGITSGPYQVGLYSGADRVRKPAQALLSPIGMVFFPKMIALAKDGVDGVKAAFRLVIIQGLLGLAITLGLLVTAPLAVHILLGPKFADAVPILCLQSLLIAIMGGSNALGLMIMIPFGLKREFSYCMLAGGIIGTVCAFIFSHMWGALGTSIAAITAEVTIAVLMFWITHKRLNLLQKQMPTG